MPLEFKKCKTQIENNIKISNLVEKLNILFKEYICAIWIPKAIENAMVELKNINNKIDELGEEPKDMNFVELLKKIIELLKNRMEEQQIIKIEENRNKKELKVSPNHILGMDESLKIDNWRNEIKYEIKKTQKLIYTNVLGRIKSIFDEKPKLKLERFTLLREVIINKYDTMYLTKRDNFDRNMDYHLINIEYFLSNDIEIFAINKNLQEIFYPIITILEKFILELKEKKEIFVECESYAQKRLKLNARKSSVLKGIKELNDLKEK